MSQSSTRHLTSQTHVQMVKPITHRPIGTRSGANKRMKHPATKTPHGGTARSESGKTRGKK